MAGIVFADDCAEAAKRGDKNLEKILKRDIHRVAPDTPACDLIPPLAEINYPLAVVSEEDRLLGIVVKGSLLAGLAEGTSF